MIWYVATLIASVFSTRGTAAQGELKCNISDLCICLCARSALLLKNRMACSFFLGGGPDGGSVSIYLFLYFFISHRHVKVQPR